MKKIIYLFVFIIAIAFNACEYVDIVQDTSSKIEVPEDLSFINDIAPIFKEQSCTNCHPAMSQPDLGASNGYASLMNGGYINQENPGSSKLLTTANAGGSHAAQLTREQAAYIIAWIEQGAADN